MEKTLVPRILGFLVLRLFGFHEAQSAIDVLSICVFIIIFSILGVARVEVLRKYKLLAIAAALCVCGLFALWKLRVSDGMKYGPQVHAAVGVCVLFTIYTFPGEQMNASQLVDDAGLAIGIMVSCRMFGSMTGLAIGATVFQSVFEQRIAKLGQLPGELALHLESGREGFD